MSPEIVIGSRRNLDGQFTGAHFFDLDEAQGSSIGLRRLAGSALARILETKSKRAVIMVTPGAEESLRLVRRMIKRTIPDVSIEFRSPDLDLETALIELRLGNIDRIIRTESSASSGSGDRATVLYRDEKGVIRWERPQTATRSSGRTLLVFMPAWINHCPPFGLAYISGALRAAGHETDVLDLNWHFWRQARARLDELSFFGNVPTWSLKNRYAEEVRPHLEETFSVLREELSAKNYSYVGLSLLDTNLLPSEDAFSVIRGVSPAARIFCGGPSCLPDWASEAITSGRIDGAVFGEGEVSVVDLLNAWKAGREAPIPGTFTRTQDGSVSKGGTRPLANINQLPKPDFSGFHLYDYDTLMLPIHFGRGCVAHCAFCEETQYWVRFRILSPDNLVEAIQTAISRYGIRSFQFHDSLMNGSHKHLERFVDKLLELDLKIKFSGYCRLDGELTGNLLQKMARAGCVRISFGMESGSQKVTNLMKKEVDVRNYERIIRDAHAADIDVVVCVIVGFPGETWSDFAKTAQLIFRLRKCIGNLNLSIMGLTPRSLVSKDFEGFGIHFEGSDWEADDGTSTPRIRKIRWWLLNRMWRWLRRRPTSPWGWTYKATG